MVSHINHPATKSSSLLFTPIFKPPQPGELKILTECDMILCQSLLPAGVQIHSWDLKNLTHSVLLMLMGFCGLAN